LFLSRAVCGGVRLCKKAIAGSFVGPHEHVVVLIAGIFITKLKGQKMFGATSRDALSEPW